ncbi:MAG: YggS family pyridoxal phosphate-dependent enzyme [Nitrospira sp. SB0677_bin_15]|nr:YggS family pyridoxal phosphate-dependent enzyme [Nitrospira sp. SB0677_bin_15]MYH02644.1 YggS family pyridoxal phosphate-dependent enzyme [Nitrospira sp. SB0675_bin_23]
MQATRDRIRRAAERAGRDPSDVRLVAATKYVEASRVLDAIRVGLTIFGENRWQEARDKMQAVGERGNVEWHFIGRLQRRKLKWLAGRFNLIHSVESLEQAEEIQRRAHERHISQAILLEVNVGGEESKGGLSVDALPSAISQIDAFPSVCVQGLMTVPPWNPDPELMRPYFQRLKQLAELVSSLPLQRVRMRELSMGMSNDFEVAVEEGATLVRVGTALFGPRRETVVAES